jgi:hypothetical protein
MSLVLIVYLGVYVPLVALNQIADHTGQDWPTRGVSTDGRRSGIQCRPHWCRSRWNWLKPWPFRRGTIRECPQAGDVDKCTGEVYNGQWWYSPPGSERGKGRVYEPR